MYQIMIKVYHTKVDEDGNLVGTEYSDAKEIFDRATEINTKVGSIICSNDSFQARGYLSETDDISMFDGIPDDVEISCTEIREGAFDA